MSNWLYRLITLTIMTSLLSCSVNANTYKDDSFYAQEVSEQDYDNSNQNSNNDYNGFEYAYSVLAYSFNHYSADIQQNYFLSFTEEEAKQIDNVLSHTFLLLEKYCEALRDNDSESCNLLVEKLSSMVPDIKRSLAPVLVPKNLIGSSLAFDENGPILDEKGFLLENGEHINVVGDGFLFSNPTSIEELGDWFGLLGDGYCVPYYLVSAASHKDNITILQLPLFFSKSVSLYYDMIESVSREFSIDYFQISIVDDKFMVGDRILRKLNEKEKMLYDSICFIILVERGYSADLSSLINETNVIDDSYAELLEEIYKEMIFPEEQDKDANSKKIL